MDRARRELARARAEVKVREGWLRSEKGRSYVLTRVDRSTKAAQPAKAQNRSLERKVRRIEKRIRTVERVMERVQVAEQLGLKSINRPVTTRDPTQLLRRVDATATQTLSRASQQQLQQARTQVRTIKLGRGLGR